MKSEFASTVVMTLFSLLLVAGYVCLFQVFQADRQEGRAAMEQKAIAPESEHLTLQIPE